MSSLGLTTGQGHCAEFLGIQRPVVQMMDNSIHPINYYPVDSIVGFVNTNPPDSDLSVG